MSRIVPALCIAVLLGTASGAAATQSCVFTFSMTSGADVNNLDMVVNYAGAGGNVNGTDAHPECARALGGSALIASHDDDAGHLTVAVIRNAKYSAPVTLAGCRFIADGPAPTPEDFNVTVTHAGSDGEDDNIVPKPTVSVTEVECPGELPTATTTTTTLETTTTTTLPSGDRCGFPLSDGEKPGASDALYTLKASVNLVPCALCICDVNSGGTIGASDALAVLRAAVGIATVLNCPAC